jgi:hypothetical protein
MTYLWDGVNASPQPDDLDKRAWLKSLKSYGPAWEAAIDFGIDVSLIELNLELTFEERLINLERMLALQDELRPEGPVLGNPPAP